MRMQLEVNGSGPPLVIVGGGLTGVLSFVPHAERLAPNRQLARRSHSEMGAFQATAEPSH